MNKSMNPNAWQWINILKKEISNIFNENIELFSKAFIELFYDSSLMSNTTYLAIKDNWKPVSKSLTNLSSLISNIELIEDDNKHFIRISFAN